MTNLRVSSIVGLFCWLSLVAMGWLVALGTVQVSWPVLTAFLLWLIMGTLAGAVGGRYVPRG